MAIHDIGDRVTITGEFTDVAGDPADPTTVALTVTAPDGDVTTPTPSSGTVGTWTAEVEPTSAGTWRYRWAGAGALVVAEEGSFEVRPQGGIALDAETELRAMVSADHDPTLSSQEIVIILAKGKLADSAGRAPSHDDWTPTYDLNRAAAEGWRWKAGKVASRFDFGSDVNRFSRSQLHEHCMNMAKEYRRKIHTDLYIPSIITTSSIDPVSGNV